ncbi:hypothetical protein Syun_019035 [Stephania yunnanensis]|uniref:Uncharacterized protein n=1 Tax=Stephania yunnanensis TaxID=152371 RepID=A0AAP0NWB8_9MAGN
MEPAKIDWSTIQSIYVEDDLYEHINAPKWFDFSALDDSAVADEAWFCKPDCRHPKTADDFFFNSKLEHVISVTESKILPLRDANMKRRLIISSSSIQSNNGLGKEKFREDGDENENPNLHTPNHQQRKQVKATIKSSTEKKKRLMMNESLTPNCSQDDQQKVKNVSARNLGKEIVNHISEICNELKKLALVEEKQKSHKHVVDCAKEKPLNGSKEKDKPLNRNLKKEGICVDLKKVGKGEEENVLQVRTSPPTPQCFSAASSRMPLRTLRTATALNPSTILERRNILQETEPNNRLVVPTDSGENNNQRNIAVSNTEAKSLDVFWFLRPCALLTK